MRSQQTVHFGAHWAAVLIACLVTAAQAGGGGGGTEAPRYDLTINRLLHRFDFEEADDKNFEEMPKHWFIMGRPGQTTDPNFLRQPMHQELLKRTGFPKFTTVRFNIPSEEKGEHNLHLKLNGGSAGAFMEIGTLAAVPNSDYLVTGRIRTSPLRFARTRLVAYFIDGEGKRIEPSVVTTDLMQTENDWRHISLKLTGEHSSAAWIGMQVELLQPQEQPVSVPGGVFQDSIGRHTIVYQELTGDAWFDDLAVWQVPRIGMKTQSPVNLINAPQHPQLTMEVRDLTGQTLNADVTVYDHRMRLVAQMSRKVGGGEGSIWHWAPTLPGLGWYLVDMKLHDPNAASDAKAPPIVARTVRAFHWLAPRTALPAQDRRRFVIDLHDAPLREVALVPLVLRATALNGVAVSGWDAAATIDSLDARQTELDRLLQPMLKENVQITLNLSPLPQALADRLHIDATQPLTLFTKPASEWSAYLAPILLRQGQNIRSWQFGQPEHAARPSASTAPAAAAVVEALQRLTPDPRVGLPWSANVERLPELDGMRLEYVVDVPPSVLPDDIQRHIGDWRQSSESMVILHLREPTAEEMSQARRVDDFAVRMLYAWEADPLGVSIPRPWAFSDSKQATLHPDPILGVFASVVHRLHGRKVAGTFNLADDVRAMVFTAPPASPGSAGSPGSPNSPNARGNVIAIWSQAQDDDAARLETKALPQYPLVNGALLNGALVSGGGEGAKPSSANITSRTSQSPTSTSQSPASASHGSNSQPRTVRLFLGDEVQGFDVWGNPVNIPFADGKHAVPISSSVVFIEGVDAELALMRASFRVSPTLIESQSIAKPHEMTLTNPWPMTINGELTIIEPGREWRIDPRRRNVTIEPRGTLTIPLEITAPVNEPGGRKNLVVRLEFNARRQYKVDLTAPLELGLKDLQLETGISFEKDARTGQVDALATAFITNVGERQRTVYAFANLQGHQRQEQIVTLKPGQSVLRRFRFRNGAVSLETRPIRLGVRDASGPALLSHVLKVDE